ncbi:MAG TPA: MFS transporter [Chloroflexota bacterium]|nr:MFS transporter [Chloroflexota bacterium]
MNIAAALAGSRARIRNVETFSSLQANPNFRLYWIGSFVSNFGTWMQSVAQGWLVYQLTGSTFMLGVVGFAQSIPFLFLALFGGVLADRFERRRLMVWTQTGLMLLAFLLAGLTLAGVVTVWHVLAIALANGVVNAFNVPVRQSIISDLVPKEHLANAIAVNSSQVQLSRFLGPALAGLMLALTNAGWCFFLNAVSFLAVIWTLVVMDVPPLPPRAPQSPLRSIREGLAYVRAQPTISALLVMAAIPSLFALPYQQMLPAFAESVLDAGPSGLGLLQSAAGLGALVGALAVASLAGRRSGWLMLAAVVVLGCGLIAFSASTTLWLSLPLLFVTGGASMTYNTLNQGFLQRRVSDEMRGRVLSLLTMTMFGLQPFGSVEVGTLASFVGPQLALGFGGAVCVVAALLALSRWPTLRALR